MATESAPLMIDGASAPKGGDRKRHRQPVIAGRVGLSAAKAPRAAQVKSVGEFLDIRSQRLEIRARAR